MRFKKFALLSLLTLAVALTFAANSWAVGSISGRITLEHEFAVLPVIGASVTALADSHFVGMAHTDSNGNYQIKNLPPGSYKVVACKFGLGCLFYPGVLHPDSADPVAVLDGQTTSGIDIQFCPFVPPPPRFGLITGRITDASSGDGIAGAHVVAKPDNLLPVIFETTTFPNGNYTLPVPAGNYNVAAVALGFLPAVYSGNPVVVDSGDTAAGVDIALNHFSFGFGSISGQITDKNTGLPISHALVISRQLNGLGFGADLTDENGNYQIERLPQGLYKVASVARDYFPAVYPDSVPVDSGQDTPNINLALMPIPPADLGTISGTVTRDSTASSPAYDSTGKPIEGAIVAAVGFDSVHNHRIVRFAHTDSTGNYVIGGLPKIPYFVLAWARGYFGEIYDNVRRFEDATKVTPDASGINFALTQKPDSGNSVAGLVRSSIGAPLPGVWVNVSDGSNSVVGAGVSLPDGGFIIDGLAAGTYTISATNDAGATVSQSVDLSGGSVSNLTLTLAGSANLRGDLNRDGVYTSADVVLILNAAFLGEVGNIDPMAADVDCDGFLTSSDVVREMNFVFLGQSSPICGF